MSDDSIPVYDADDRVDRKILYHDNGDGTFSPTAYLVGAVKKTIVLEGRPVITPGVAYANNQWLGSTVIQFPNAARVAGGGGRIVSAVYTDKAKVAAALNLWVFDSQPVTTFADRSTLNLDAADLPKLVNFFTLGTSWPLAAAYVAHYTSDVEQHIGYTCKGGTSLYAMMSARTAATFAAADDVLIRVWVERD
jgi:hypothetical protein